MVGEERELAGVDQVADYKFLGKIVTVKTKEAYGFIRGEQMDDDVFFGINHCVPALRHRAETSGGLEGTLVRFTVLYNGKRSLGARHVEEVEDGWTPMRLRARIMEWVGEDCLLQVIPSTSVVNCFQFNLLLQVTSGSGISAPGNRLWCSAVECSGLVRGKVGTPLTFQLGVNPTFRLEARLLQPDCSRVEVEEVVSEPARERRNSSAGEQLVAVKQVTTEHFSSSLIAEIANMDTSALSLVFDKQLRQRLLTLVQQPVGSR